MSIASDTAIALLDVRRHRGDCQVRGAVHYDPDRLIGAPDLVLPISRGQTILVYSDDDETARETVRKLRRYGYLHAEFVAGGLAAMESAGARLEPPTQEQPIPGDAQAGIPLP